MRDVINQILSFDIGTKMFFILGIISTIILVGIYIAVITDFIIHLFRKH
jgi:hypothetical protein